MRIAVIQDGTELARQTDADISGSFERCCELMAADGLDATAELFTDDTVGALLEHLDTGAYDCVVVASNALNSGRVERALVAGSARLGRYLDTGGGLVVLHQIVDDLKVVPLTEAPGLADRRSDHGAATALDSDDILLNHPFPVALDDLRDGGLPGPPSLYYRAMPAETLPEALKPVLACGEDVLVARSYDHVKQRLVIATLPLDWQRAYDLLTNILRFAALGRPRRLLLREGSWSRRELLTRWLTADGGTSVRPVPAHGSGFGPTERWLLRNVELVVVPSARLPSMERDAEMIEFLARGGTIVTADQATRHRDRRIVALVGEHAERQLAAQLYGELRAVTGWDSVDYAFELRNIMLAVAALWADPVNHGPMAVDPAELEHLRGPLCDRLRAPVHREDLSSSIAHAQSLALLTGAPLPEDVYEWMAADPRTARLDVGVQVRAVRALARREPDPTFTVAAVAALQDQKTTASVAPVVRVLDTVAVLDQAGLLQDEPEAVRDLTGLACDLLAQSGEDPAVGWLSIEATADLARGLMVLIGRLPPGSAAVADEAVDHLSAAVAVLRRALRQYERNRKGVAWLARVIHTLVEADRRFPVRLRGLADLDWPRPGAEHQAEAGMERPLLEHLASENKTLRDHTVELEADRTAARTGRAAATLGATLLVCVPFGYLLFVIGFESVWALLGNIAILATMLLGLVTGVFDLLARHRLLADPAQRVYDLVVRVVPVASAVSRLSRK